MKIKYIFPLVAFLLLFWSCRNNTPEPLSFTEQLGTATSNADTAAILIRRTIERHGGTRYQNLDLKFVFRKHDYRAIRKDGRFVYSREFTDDAGSKIKDVLSNEGFYREADGVRLTLTGKDSLAFAESVNSVVYFILQPAFLTDPAVRASYLGTGKLKGEIYDKLKITFAQEGGGIDYQDEFVYWIHADRHTLDYLAYNYLTNGGGARFREGFNFREAAGIRFADYINYKPANGNRAVETFDLLFESGKLTEVSRIINEDIQLSLPE